MEIIGCEILNQTAFYIIGKIVNLNDYQKLRNYCNNIKINNNILIADLSRLSFSSTHGLGILITIFKTMEKIGKHFIIVSPKEEILTTMKLIGIDQVIPVFEDISKLSTHIHTFLDTSKSQSPEDENAPTVTC